MKFSKAEGVIAYSGGTMPIKKGMRFDDDHPLVAERPELFNDTDPGADHKTPTMLVGSVERATAEPGEARVTPGTGPQQGKNRVPRGSVQ